MNIEAQRLAALQSCAILDTAPHPSFDCIVRATALALDVPIALVSLVDAERQWFKAALGVTLRETPRKVSFCSHAIEGYEPMVIPDATKDARFVDNALVTGEPFIRFYAGAPLIDSDGYALGTLCVLDREPRELDQKGIRLLGHLADAVMHSIEAHRMRLELKDAVRRAGLRQDSLPQDELLARSA